jgi:transmembrane sensor
VVNQDSAGNLKRWEEALVWYITLRNAGETDLTAEVRRAWQDWCADPKNEGISDHVGSLLMDRKLYRVRCRHSKAELEEDRYDLTVPIAEWRRTQSQEVIRGQRIPARTWAWRLPAGIAVAAIAVLFVAAAPRFWSSVVPSPVIYQTDIGGFKNVHLSDGTNVLLGSRTKLSVTLSSRHRIVRLFEGRAWFKVAHDPYRPFVVHAGDETITDLGTAFVVTRDSDRVVVTVTEGAIEVSDQPPLTALSKLAQTFALRQAVALAPIRVSRGEELTFGAKAAPNVAKHTDISAATAWARAVLTFDDQPLRYVVDTINRYSTARILVSPAAGALRLTATFPEDELDENHVEEWAQSLQVILPITVDKRPGGICIQMRGQAHGVAEFCGAY